MQNFETSSLVLRQFFLIIGLSPSVVHGCNILILFWPHNTLALVASEEWHFEYTAIAVVFGYGNTPIRLHTHMNDHSPISGSITGGDYVGGALFVEEGGLLWEGGGGAGHWHK